MNWVDLLIIIILIFFAFESLGRSLISEILDFLSFLLSFILAVRFYNEVANLLQSYFSLPHSFALALGFLLFWALCESALMLIVNLIIVRFKFPGWFRYFNFFSLIPAVFKGVILIAIFLIFIASFPIQPQIKKAVDSSKIGSLIVTRFQALESPLKNIFGAVTEDSLTFLTIKPNTNESVDLGFKALEFYPNENLEMQMIDLVNKERREKGLKELVFDGNLREVARDHSSDMFSRGYFSHYSPEGKDVADRAEEKGISYLVIGENLAYAPSLSLAHNGLMNSPGHRANILSLDFGKIGIGVMDGSEYGLMITQVFSN